MPRSIANEAETAKEHREAAKAWPSFIIHGQIGQFRRSGTNKKTTIKLTSTLDISVQNSDDRRLAREIWPVFSSLYWSSACCWTETLWQGGPHQPCTKKSLKLSWRWVAPDSEEVPQNAHSGLHQRHVCRATFLAKKCFPESNICHNLSTLKRHDARICKYVGYLWAPVLSCGQRVAF